MKSHLMQRTWGLINKMDLVLFVLYSFVLIYTYSLAKDSLYWLGARHGHLWPARCPPSRLESGVFKHKAGTVSCPFLVNNRQTLSFHSWQTSIVAHRALFPRPQNPCEESGSTFSDRKLTILCRSTHNTGRVQRRKKQTHRNQFHLQLLHLETCAVASTATTSLCSWNTPALSTAQGKQKTSNIQKETPCPNTLLCVIMTVFSNKETSLGGGINSL